MDAEIGRRLAGQIRSDLLATEHGLPNSPKVTQAQLGEQVTCPSQSSISHLHTLSRPSVDIDPFAKSGVGPFGGAPLKLDLRREPRFLEARHM